MVSYLNEKKSLFITMKGGSDFVLALAFAMCISLVPKCSAYISTGHLRRPRFFQSSPYGNHRLNRRQGAEIGDMSEPSEGADEEPGEEHWTKLYMAGNSKRADKKVEDGV